MTEGQMTQSTYLEIDACPARITALENGKADSTALTAETTARTEADAKHLAALVELVDSGAKNIADMSKSTFTSTQKDGVTVTLSGDTITSTGNSGTTTNSFYNVFYASSQILIPSGNWVASLSGTGIENFRLEEYDNVTGDVRKGDFGAPFPFTVPNGVTSSYLRITQKPSSNCAGTFKLMICSKAAGDISHAFVPYCPSLPELYAMIQGGTRSLQRSISTTQEETIEEPTETQTEETEGKNR